jgi:hypothetical protein
MRRLTIMAMSLVLLSKTYAATSLPPPQTSPQHVTNGVEIKLPRNMAKILKARSISLHHSKSLARCPGMPSNVQLGMNGVPVLNQSLHIGVESVFATTAAVDAALGKGDYISQLCLLQLSNYMVNYGHTSSGWNGTLLPDEWKRLENFGFVSKEQQQDKGCGGLTEYPEVIANSSTSSISYDDYHQMSENLWDNFLLWSPILDLKQAISEPTDTNETLHEIKKSLHHGNRVTTTFLVIGTEIGTPGTSGTYHEKNDTWILTTPFLRQLGKFPPLYPHFMVITGYNDHARAIDEKGRVHKGLLTLRGSWGTEVGDQGDFYMSYDYFRVLVLDAQELKQVASD